MIKKWVPKRNEKKNRSREQSAKQQGYLDVSTESKVRIMIILGDRGLVSRSRGK